MTDKDFVKALGLDKFKYNYKMDMAFITVTLLQVGFVLMLAYVVVNIGQK